MSKAQPSFAWRTFMFAVAGQDAGPLALGAGASRDEALVDAHRRMVQRRVVDTSGPLRPTAERLQAELAQLASKVVARDEAFQDSFGASKSVTPDGHPMVLFHGTTSQFDHFDTSPHRSFGAHFGTPGQAMEFIAQPGGHMIPVYLAISNPVRLTDAGTWGAYEVALQLNRQQLISPELYAKVRAWSDESDDDGVVEGEFDPYQAMRAELHERGIDGIVYLNRSEGTGVQDREWPTSMSDADFLQYIPHAKDSWIAFRPDQIRRAMPQRPIAAEAFGAAIEQVYKSQPFWKLMLEESRVEAGPFDGGCLIVAQAMILAAGRGELVRVASDANDAEHYGARIDGVIYDFNGASASPDAWVERVVSAQAAADWERGWHFAEGFVNSPDVLDDLKTSSKIAEMLRDALPALRPEFAWRPTSELALGSSLMVVHEAPGPYPAVEQMGHDYVNNETQLVAATLGSSASLSRRMQTVGFDPAKAKLVLGAPALRAARDAEIDLKMVDWSEVTAEFFPDAVHETQIQPQEPAALENLPAAAVIASTPALTVLAGGEGRRIDEDVLDLLRRCAVDGNLVRLPPQRLDPKFYARVDAVLKGLGGVGTPSVGATFSASLMPTPRRSCRWRSPRVAS